MRRLSSNLISFDKRLGLKKVYFLSDTHLGAPYMGSSRDAELRVVRFLDRIKEDASEIYLLGDILDYWYEYRYVVPRGYVRFLGKLAELTDVGIKITWLIGNHDIWIFDYIPSETGVEVIDGILDREILGTRMVLTHGDGVWQSSKKFRILRKVFRNKLCQRMFAAIHPRWTVPFAYAWSSHSREGGGFDGGKNHDNCSGKDVLSSNIEGLRHFCENYLLTHPDCRYFLFGHLHKLIREPVGTDSEMIVLGDWLELFSYAVFDGESMILKRAEDLV